MKKYKISYFRKGIGEIEYETTLFINKETAKDYILNNNLGINTYSLNKSTRQQMKELGIKNLKIKVIK